MLHKKLPPDDDDDNTNLVEVTGVFTFIIVFNHVTLYGKFSFPYTCAFSGGKVMVLAFKILPHTLDVFTLQPVIYPPT